RSERPPDRASSRSSPAETSIWSASVPWERAAKTHKQLLIDRGHVPVYRRNVTSDAAAVAAANLSFYRALESRDVETMSHVWLHDEAASCVHPGWHRLDGWEEIERSWQNIFANSRPWSVACEDVRIAVAGDLAWVTCVEVIVPFGGDE